MCKLTSLGMCVHVCCRAMLVTIARILVTITVYRTTCTTNDSQTSASTSDIYACLSFETFETLSSDKLNMDSIILISFRYIAGYNNLITQRVRCT